MKIPIFLMKSLLFFFFVLPYLVLQECATDSEELIYPIRAPSSCSAPPDLLLTGDRNKDAKVQSATPRNDAIAPDRMLLEVSLIGCFTLIKTHTLFNTCVEFKLKFSSDFSTNYNSVFLSLCRNSRAMYQLKAVENQHNHFNFPLHSMIWTDIMEK